MSRDVSDRSPFATSVPRTRIITGYPGARWRSEPPWSSSRSNSGAIVISSVLPSEQAGLLGRRRRRGGRGGGPQQRGEVLLALARRERGVLADPAGAHVLEQRLVEPDHPVRAAALHEVRQ